MFMVYSGKCFYSGRNLELEEIHIDHILPKKEGGKDNIENYVLCCQELNLLKNDSYSIGFVKVVSEFNKLVYCNKVVSTYNELNFNTEILKEYIEINQYCQQNKIINKPSFVTRAKNKLTFIRKPKLGQSKNKLYFKKNELDTISRIGRWTRKH